MSYDTGLSYRRSAIEGASGIGLVIALYDTLWGDLRRSVDALRQHDIEVRCRELNHGFLVLGQLECWVATENGGDLAASLKQFYHYLRARMMEASIQQSVTVLEELMDLILHVRSAWQQRDMEAVGSGVSPSEPKTLPSVTEASRHIALSFSA